MKKEKFLLPLVLVAALGLLFSVESFAAEEAATGPAAAPKYKRMYDPATVETISGEVLQVKRIPHRRRAAHGVHLVVKTEKEEIPVSLGPSWYLDKQEVKIAEKDKVEVKGSRVTMKGGKPAIIAAEVKKGTAVLKLREADGTAVWRR